MTTAGLADGLDALVAEFAAGAAGCEGKQAAMRTPRAAWCAVLAHAQHKITQVDRLNGPAEGRA